MRFKRRILLPFGEVIHRRKNPGAQAAWLHALDSTGVGNV